MNPRLQIRLRNACVALIAFALALAIWLPCPHFFFRKPLSDCDRHARFELLNQRAVKAVREIGCGRVHKLAGRTAEGEVGEGQPVGEVG